MFPDLPPVLNYLIDYFAFLRGLGFEVVEARQVDMPLVGPVATIDWSNPRAGRLIRFTFSPGAEDRPPVLSILVKSDQGSFTYTDWLHAMQETANLPANDLSAAPDVKAGVHDLARAFERSTTGMLGKILAGKAWIDVPTYRGVNE